MQQPGATHATRFRTLTAAVLLAAAYFVAGKLSLKLAFLNASASPVWPPSGIAIAALLLFSYRLWPGIFAGAFLVNIFTTGKIVASLGIAAGNTLESVIAVVLIRQTASGLCAFDRAYDVFRFALALSLSTVVSATIGTTTLALCGLASWMNYGAIWVTWWMGDLSGAVLFAPVLILWLGYPWRRLNLVQDAEVAILIVLLAILSEVVFGGWFSVSTLNYPIAFILGPFIVWTAFRLTARETATSLFVLSAIAIWGTLHKYGPFVRSDDNQSLLLLQSFNVLTTITALALAAGMSERRRAEVALEQQRASVEAANRTKDNFLAMLSHELRTPLTPVLAALDAFKSEQQPPPEAEKTFDMMRRNIELESQLIDDLLDLTRITKEKMLLDLQPVDAHQAVRNVVEMCASEANGKRLHVRFDLQASDHQVLADPAKFQQIIWNLFKNAIKFTGEKGEITISSANHLPHILTLAVADTGIGIEPEIMERIFNPFEQGERSFQRRFGGLGLGLTISKSLAQAHGASLIAKSEGLNQGATFLLTMKTAELEKAEKPLAPEPPAAPVGLRILLVDDHPDTCAALERLLTLRGHRVTAAQNMRSALELAGDGASFDLLVSDVGLPDGNGMDLLRVLRTRCPIRGIAISGFGMDADIGKSMEAGFSEHLVKPVKLEKLEAAIARIMPSSENSPAL